MQQLAPGEPNDAPASGSRPHRGKVVNFSATHGQKRRSSIIREARHQNLEVAETNLFQGRPAETVNALCVLHCTKNTTLRICHVQYLFSCKRYQYRIWLNLMNRIMNNRACTTNSVNFQIADEQSLWHTLILSWIVCIEGGSLCWASNCLFVELQKYQTN